MLPHAMEPKIDLFAEGPDERSAEALLEEYAALVIETISADEE
jgi:hypothetical protein